MKTKQILICGFGIALVFVLTAFTAFSITGFGYVNLGDSAILLFASLLAPIPAAIVGGIGSMMSDLYLGYSQYAIFTLFIKGLEAFIVSYLFYTLPKKIRLFAFFVGIIEMVFGYYLVDAFLFGSFIAVLPAVVSNVTQGAVSLAFGCFAQLSFARVAKQHPTLFDRE